MKILLTGSTGQLGQEIIRSKPNDVELINLDRKNFNLEDLDHCYNFIKEFKPDWVINTAAFTNVEESEVNIKKTYLINQKAPEVIAKALNAFGGKLLQISTDYVFDGNKNKPYRVDDEVNPLNIYGKSKALCEDSLKKTFKDENRLLIIRTSWLISHIGENFLKKILKLINEKDEVKVIDDQIGCITSTKSLSKACWKLIEKNESNSKKLLRMSSLHHWSDEGVVSWYDIALMIKNISQNMGLTKNKCKIIPIKTNEFNLRAKRPNYSVLDCSETSKLINLNRSFWEDSIIEIIKKIAIINERDLYGKV